TPPDLAFNRGAPRLCRGPPKTKGKVAGPRSEARSEAPVTPPNLAFNRGAPRLCRGAPNDGGSGGHFWAPSKNVHRITRAVGVHVSRRSRAAGIARGGGGAARDAGAGA